MTLERVTTAAIVADAAVFAWSLIDHAHAEVDDKAERALLCYFVLEMTVHLSRERWQFFRSSWRVFDLAMICLSLLPALPGATVLRLARLARVAKLAHVLRHASQLRPDRIPNSALAGMRST